MAGNGRRGGVLGPGKEVDAQAAWGAVWVKNWLLRLLDVLFIGHGPGQPLRSGLAATQTVISPVM